MQTLLLNIEQNQSTYTAIVRNMASIILKTDFEVQV